MIQFEKTGLLGKKFHSAWKSNYKFSLSKLEIDHAFSRYSALSIRE